MKLMSRILVVDDEPKIVEMVRLYLERDGHDVSIARDGNEALARFRRDEPDLILLDLMLPGVDGVEVCRRVRRESATPVIMLTARAEEGDKLLGLEVGADDYVTKPFSPRELAARVRAVLRRSEKRSALADSIEREGLSMDLARHEVELEGRPLSLTPREFRILWQLAANPGRAYSRAQLLDDALGDDFEGYERNVDAHVKNLRRKLAEVSDRVWIETVYGVGYRMPEAARAPA